MQTFKQVAKSKMLYIPLTFGKHPRAPFPTKNEFPSLFLSDLRVFFSIVLAFNGMGVERVHCKIVCSSPLLLRFIFHIGLLKV